MTTDAAVRRRAPVADAAAAALAVLFLVAVTRHIDPLAGERSLDLLGYALLGAAGLSVGLARWWPRSVVAAVTAVLLAYALRGYAGGPVFATGWYALVQLRLRTDRRTAVGGATLLCAVLVVTGGVADGGVSVVSLVFVGWSAAAVLLGDVLAERRRRIAELRERARYLERTHEEEARRRVAEERLRIARDLHDTVAHAMATINVQAGAAAHVVDRRPEAAKEALAAISRASGEALDELAAILTLLRDEGEAAERAPTPGLDRVPDLVATSTRNGLPVTLTVTGPVERVPTAVGTAAYRIVQESLTNVLRHAPGAATEVAVDASADGALRVTVTDDGGQVAVAPGVRAVSPEARAAAAAAAGMPPVPAVVGAGVGLQGMRERAAATGGHLTAGLVPSGGFRVTATWPPRPATAAAPAAPAPATEDGP